MPVVVVPLQAHRVGVITPQITGGVAHEHPGSQGFSIFTTLPSGSNVHRQVAGPPQDGSLVVDGRFKQSQVVVVELLVEVVVEVVEEQ